MHLTEIPALCGYFGVAWTESSNLYRIWIKVITIQASFSNLYTVERPILISLEMFVAPMPFSCKESTSFLSMVRLRPNFIPLALASIRPSFMRSRMRWRSA